MSECVYFHNTCTHMYECVDIDAYMHRQKWQRDVKNGMVCVCVCLYVYNDDDDDDVCKAVLYYCNMFNLVKSCLALVCM